MRFKKAIYIAYSDYTYRVEKIRNEISRSRFYNGWTVGLFPVGTDLTEAGDALADEFCRRFPHIRTLGGCVQWVDEQ